MTDEPMDPEPAVPAPKGKYILPSIQNFILCDLATLDRFSGKHSLINVFEQFQSAIFPVTCHCWYYVLLVDGRGNIPTRLELVNLQTNDSLVLFTGHMQFNNPLAPMAFLNRISLSFAGPGNYEFALKDNVTNRTFGTRRFVVKQLSQEPQPLPPI